jgi:hypothetical protein
MRRQQYAVKETDEAVTSSTTLQNDDDLKFYGEAGKYYEIDAMVEITNHASAGVDLKLDMPSGATFKGLVSGANVTTPPDTWDGSEVNLSAVGVTADRLHIKGVVKIGTTAGQVTLQWAQNTSTGSATTLKAGSFLKAFRLGRG